MCIEVTINKENPNQPPTIYDKSKYQKSIGESNCTHAETPFSYFPRDFSFMEFRRFRQDTAS